MLCRFVPLAAVPFLKSIGLIYFLTHGAPLLISGEIIQTMFRQGLAKSHPRRPRASQSGAGELARSPFLKTFFAPFRLSTTDCLWVSKDGKIMVYRYN